MSCEVFFIEYECFIIQVRQKELANIIQRYNMIVYINICMNVLDHFNIRSQFVWPFCEHLLFITKTVECKGRLAAKPYDPKRLMSCQQQWCRDDIISVSIIVIIAMASTDDLNLASFNQPNSSRPNYFDLFCKPYCCS